MTSSNKADWLIPSALIALSFIPILISVFSMMQIVAGVQTPDNARFLAMPWPIMLHGVGMTIFCVVGAFQFSPGLRRRKPGMHRAAGRLAVVCGLVGAMAGLWMTLFYPAGNVSPATFDGPYLLVIRLLAGGAMALFLVLGLASILRRDIPNHKAWMMRAYALALGAGMQVFTHIPWLMFPSIHGELARALCMAAGWMINLAVAEAMIFRERHSYRQLLLHRVRQIKRRSAQVRSRYI